LKSKHERFDRSRLLLKPVAERVHGKSFYFCGDHRATLPALRRALLEASA